MNYFVSNTDKFLNVIVTGIISRFNAKYDRYCSLNLSYKSKEIIQITKTATSSFNIINYSTGLLGTFDNLYTITGSSDSILNNQLKSS